jgi:hypothetical protein
MMLLRGLKGADGDAASRAPSANRSSALSKLTNHHAQHTSQYRQLPRRTSPYLLDGDFANYLHDFRPRKVIPAAAMPTPESELFLAKKPKVAPTFDGVDYEDNTALKGAQDAIIREQWVRSMMARLVRDEMGKCYRREGVNHLEKCGHLRGRSSSGHA